MRTFLLLGLVACSGSAGTTNPPIEGDATPAACAEGSSYPEGIARPMELGAVLAPYSWPEAIHRGTGERLPLDLANVPCAIDPDIDWSPFEALLFVSIPAW